MRLFLKFEESIMSDDKTKKGGGDRSRVAAGEDYEVRYFAEKHGITPDQVRDLIKRHGNSRDKLEAAAERLAKAK
jgi:hypothetical protein